jgi:hypothetical protein
MAEKFTAIMLRKDPLVENRNLLLLCLYLQEQQALHYELHKNIALQRRVTLGQAETIQTFKQENVNLKKQLADAQCWFPSYLQIIHVPNSKFILTYLWIGASSSLATASTELETLRSSYKDLEVKLAGAEKKKERAEKQLAEKNSELIQKKVSLE